MRESTDQDKKLRQKRVTKSHRYKRAFQTEAGSWVLKDLMESHFMASNTYSRDPVEMAFNEGQRNVVLRILKLVKEPIDKIEKRIEDMEKEYYDE